jgi:phosphoribosylaminoimidazole-succinocarboxamide synthase
LVKNQRLASNLLTPTTKDDAHDELISAEEIVSSGRMSQSDFDVCARYAHEIFSFSQELALQRGLILVDTKYEFGLDPDGRILLADEIHTPDSSRYWMSDSYEQRFAAGQRPDSFDKDFVRSWVSGRCDPYVDPIPAIPPEMIEQSSDVYVDAFQRITGQAFDPPPPGQDIAAPNFGRNATKD